MLGHKKHSTERVNKLLQEIRIVLPGTQALLGFQFIAFFNAAFKTLPPHLQLYHVVNLLFVTFSTILLISPVAFQEILEDGRNTDRFLRFTSRVIEIAMLFLLVGLSGDVFIAANLLSSTSIFIPLTAALGTFLFGVAMWFGISAVKKVHR